MAIDTASADLLEAEKPEVIKPIPGFEAFYAASDHGRVFSLNYRCTGRMQELAQSILVDKRRKSTTFYRRARMWHIDRKFSVAIHIVIAKTFVQNPDGLPQVNHKDGDKGNNHATNLEWVTNSENQRHAFTSGLRIWHAGEDHHMAVLNEQQAREIKAELARVPPYKGQLTELGRRYGVTNHCIFDIKWGRSWTHL